MKVIATDLLTKASEKTLTNKPDQPMVATDKTQSSQPQKISYQERSKADAPKDMTIDAIRNTLTKPSNVNPTGTIKVDDKQIPSTNSVTMYASIVNPKSNDKTEIIKAYINEKLVPTEPKIIETAQAGNKTTSDLGVEIKQEVIDTIIAIKASKTLLNASTQEAPTPPP